MIKQTKSNLANSKLRLRTPVRSRLMAGGAMAVCLATLVAHAPVQAQTAFQGTPNVVNPGTASVSQNPGVDVVTVTAPQAVINWTPNDRNGSGTIDFLPFGNTGRFIGTQEFTVLNRIIPLDGNDTPIARLIALNGTIESFVTDPFSGAAVRGGSVWFYSPGGILVGSGATINVGSLILSARDIDTTGGLFGPGGTIRFRDPNVAGVNASTITIEPGAQIFANRASGANSYVAMVAPRIEQRSVVQADGSVALIAAERADVRISAGLFDINVLVGTEDANGIVHTGTTGGILDAPGSHIAYMVAVPKNQAMTMLLSGTIGFVPGQMAGVNAAGNIVISAGRNAANTQINNVVNGNTTGSVNIADTMFLNDLQVGATNNITVRPQGDCAPFCSPFGVFGQVQFRGNATFTADQTLNMSIGNAQRILADRDLVLRAGTDGVGGNVELAVDNAPPSSPSSSGGGVISVAGNLLVDASATGTTSVNNGAATGGFARMSATGGSITASSITVAANAIGGITATGNGATGTGGTATVTTSTDGEINTSTLLVQANGEGNGNFLNIGGEGIGGDARVLASLGMISVSQLLGVQATGSGQLGDARSGNGTGGRAEISVGAGGTLVAPLTLVDVSGVVTSNAGNLSSTPETTIGGSGNGGTALIRSSGDANLGDLIVSANGLGGASLSTEFGAPGVGGNANGGTINLSVFAGTTRVGDMQLSAIGFAGGSGNVAGTTGTANGGTIDVLVTAGSQLLNRSAARLDASASVDTFGGGAVGAANGGSIFVYADLGSLISSSSTWELFADANAEVGAGLPAARSAEDATAGNIEITAVNGATIALGAIDVRANATGAHAISNGANATGGNILFQTAAGGSLIFDETGSHISANGIAGSGQIGGTGTGGNIELFINGGTLLFDGFTSLIASGFGGQSFDGVNLANGRGGTVTIEVTSDDDSQLQFDNLSVSAGGSTALGGEGFINLGDGANATGGNLLFQIDGGTVTGRNLSLDVSGEGIGRGSGQGGTLQMFQAGGDVDIEFLSLQADGTSNNQLFGPRGGNGTGGTIEVELFGGTLATDFFGISAVGRGGDGLSSFSEAIFTGGEGGGGGGSGGCCVSIFSIYGGFAGPFVTGNYVAPSDGGDGFGGTIRFRVAGDADVTIRSDFGFQMDASGIGGEGGNAETDLLTAPRIPGMGGNGTGGTIDFTYESGTFNGVGSQPPAIVLNALGIGGEGGRLFVNPFLDCNLFDCGGLSEDDFSLPTAESGPGGGDGRGGNVRINLLGTLDNADLYLDTSGFGGGGGRSLTGGRGGDGAGGLSLLFVDNVESGSFTVELVSRGRGGAGGDGINGAGGDGGEGRGGTANLQVSGQDATIDTDNATFLVTGIGGRGGNGGVSAFTEVIPTNGHSGGNGGFGFGGTIELVAINSNLLIGMSGEGAEFASNGIGGNAGNGADNSDGPVNQARFGGNAGFGGGGFGGQVSLIADAGTIEVFNNAGLNINVTGTGGEGGAGGAGNTITLFDMMGNPTGTSGGSGFFTGRSFNAAGTIRLEANDDGESLGLISLGNAIFRASGDIAGRIELIDNSEGSGLVFDSLLAEAFGGPSVGSDFSLVGSGIYIRSDGAPIFIDGDVTLNTDGSVQVDADGDGGLIADNLFVYAGRDFVVRHVDRPDFRSTISAGVIDATAGFIDFQQGSLVNAATMFLTSFSQILFDQLSGRDLLLTADDLIEGGSVRSNGLFRAVSANGDLDIGDIDAEDGVRLTALNGDVRGDSASSEFGSILIDAGSVSYGSLFAGGEGGITINASGNVTLDRAVTTFEDDNQESGLPPGVQGQLAVLPGDFDITINAGGIVTFNQIEAQDSVFIIAASIAGAESSIFGNAGISINTTGNAVLGDLETSFGDIDVRSGGAITADFAGIGSSSAEGIFRGVNGVTVQSVRIPGTVEFTATNGAVLVNDLQSGLVTALGRTVTLNATDDIVIALAEATAGDTTLRATGGDMTVNVGRATGTFDARTPDGALSVGQVNAGRIDLVASTTAALTGAVTSTGLLNVTSTRATTVNGTAVGQEITVRSGDIVIGANGRIGALGSTNSLLLINGDSAARTFIGGADQAGEYSLSSAEMSRLFGNDIIIRAPRVSAQGGDALGLTRPPDVVIGAFTIAGGGGTGANLGSSGSLRIETPGFARVVGAAQFTGMSATNGFELDATESIEVILGQGSIRLSGNGDNGLGGTLTLTSDDVAVATASAITAITGLSDLTAIDARLAQNDGITSEEGALTANAIDITVRGGVYIQNSGVSDAFADRRGFTTNSLGIFSAPSSPSGGTPSNINIVINGRIGDAANVLTTGLAAIPLAVINSQPGGAQTGFATGSTINGCVIANPASCSTPDTEISFDFPVRDVIEEEVEEDEESTGEGSNYQSLITIRENDRSREYPLLDEPVTGSGNDDLWIPAE